MIPKQLFFIWLGNTPPAYCEFAINAFKEVNPDFKVDFLYWSVEDVENPKDEILKKSVEDAIKLNRKDRKFIQSVTNLYRYKILYRYGGIYLDCDTFPVRPFDDKLLDHTEFDVTISWGQNQFIIRDVFFLGKCPKTYLEKNPPKYTLLYPHTETGNYHELKKKFFDCTLKYGEYYGDPKLYYINHYHDFTWNPKNLRTPLCKWDEILKDKK